MTNTETERSGKPSTTADNAETEGSGLFVVAFVGGLAATLEVFLLCLGFSVFPQVFLDWDWSFLLVLGVQFSIPFFVGGIISGWIIYLEARRYSWGFLHLAAASPAMPVFSIAVLAALLGVEPRAFGLGIEAFGIVLLMCISALAGSLLGHWIGFRSRVPRGGPNSPSRSSEGMTN